MKRNMNLVRQILLEVEKQPFTGEWVDLELEEYTPEEITYHVIILYEAGLIQAQDLSTFGGVDWKPTRLTWQGHEFLETAKDDTRWKKASSIMLEKGGGMAFDVLKQLLTNLMMSQVLT